jgi:hypothetical protein
MPGAEFSGWFFNSNSPLLFSPQPDLSQPGLYLAWTSAENVAIMSSWLNLVTEAAGDPVLLSRLEGLGMNTSAGSPGTQNLANSQQAVQPAPEPELMGSLGTGLFLLVLSVAVGRRSHD